MSSPSYVAGNIVQCSGQFQDLSGNPVDPSFVEFRYTVNRAGFQEVEIPWTGATDPAPGVVARTATGLYIAQVDTTDLVGQWTWGFYSQGECQAINFNYFNVTQSYI